MSSVRYRTRLGDLKNKQSTHTVATSVPGRRVRVSSVLHNGGLPGGWRVASTSGSVSAGPYHIHRGRAPLCVDCLFLRSPSRVPYRTELIPRAPKWRRTRTPPPVIPLPESIAAQAAYQLRYKNTEYCSWAVCLGCLFLRSPSRIPYRTELIPRAPKGRVPGPPTRNPPSRIRSCRGHTPPQSAVSW
jgi:hypothetical protein